MTAPKWLADLDWESVATEALEIFQTLLRIDTQNPPGNEKEACDAISKILDGEDIPFEVFDVAPGRANLVARIPGTGESEPVLISSHLDVVPAAAEEWTHPPFGAEIADGYVWGRGAIDMKNMTAMELSCFLAASRHGNGQHKSDLVLAAVADEEAGCELGSLWLAKNHPEKVKARYAIGEFGGFTLHVGKARICPVQIAEKGVCWLRVTARGEEGHGGLPGKDHAVARIGKAASRLVDTSTPLHVTPVMAQNIRTIADTQPFPNSFLFRQVLNPLMSDLVIEKVLPDKNVARTLFALLHNTANPTIIRAGSIINAVPASAVMEVDGRTLPGQTPEDLIREVKKIIGPDFEIDVIRSMPPVEGNPNDPIFDIIRAVLKKLDPALVMVPNLVWGFTDAKAWSSLGATCIGFAPVNLGPETPFNTLMHRVDERVPVEGFKQGVRTLIEVVSRIIA